MCFLRGVLEYTTAIHGIKCLFILLRCKGIGKTMKKQKKSDD